MVTTTAEVVLLQLLFLAREAFSSCFFLFYRYSSPSGSDQERTLLKFLTPTRLRAGRLLLVCDVAQIDKTGGNRATQNTRTSCKARKEEKTLPPIISQHHETQPTSLLLWHYFCLVVKFNSIQFNTPTWLPATLPAHLTSAWLLTLVQMTFTSSWAP